MHAHLCGRLPRNTLVVAYDPELPASMISGDVAQWFRWASMRRLEGLGFWDLLLKMGWAGTWRLEGFGCGSGGGSETHHVCCRLLIQQL